MKPILGYEDYLIDENGNVYSNKTNKFLKQQLDRYGYKVIALCKDSKIKLFKVHRLVALAYIENNENKPQVNHINGNKLDNSLKNLEWATNKENVKHAWDNGLKEKIKNIFSNVNKKIVVDTSTGVFYESIYEASKYSNIRYGTLKSMLNGQNKNKTTLIFA